MSESSITIAIPLYRAARFADTVAGNLRRLRGPIRLLVSDADEQDDTLQRLKREFARRDDIEWLGARALAQGWVPHCNDLLARAHTPLFMWLPQDDEIDLDWPVGGAAALAKDPDAVLACGTIIGQDDAGNALPIHISPGEIFASRDLGARLGGAGRAFDMDGSALGIWFRAVSRREMTVPLPSTVNGEWADIIWASAMLARGPMIAIPGAVYRKTWYTDNTHGSWRPIRGENGYSAGVLEELLRAILGELPAERREEALAAIWRGADSARREHERALLADVTQALQSERMALAVLQRSWSWRLTYLLRKAARLLALPRRD
jgi:hypothetical protein